MMGRSFLLENKKGIRRIKKMDGKRIRSLRKERGMTLNQLSEYSGVSKSYISYVERGLQKNPSIEILSKLSKAMDITFIELIKHMEK
ncbi:helix-turn-helix domain-containing protein [Alkalicoccobacillus murimartini]|nr:helix-turn-helix transcriptional regulator [Alkalicoccobacillus murimartini]